MSAFHMTRSQGIYARFLQAVLLVGALCLPGWAQSDVRITQTGFYRTIAFNKTWAGTGGGALTNNYIYTPSSQVVGACIGIQNNDTNTHAISIAVSGSANSNQPIAFTGNTAAWFTLQSTAIFPSPVPASGTSAMYVRTAGAAQVVISVSGTSGAGTASIFITENTQEAPCRGGSLITFSSSGAGPLLQCTSSAHITLAASSTTLLIGAVSGLVTHICGLSLATASNLTNDGVKIIRGTKTATDCDTGPITLWGPIDLATTVGGSPYTWGGGLGQALPSTAASDEVCAVSTYTVGTVDVDVFYTQF